MGWLESSESIWQGSEQSKGTGIFLNRHFDNTFLVLTLLFLTLSSLKLLSIWIGQSQIWIYLKLGYCRIECDMPSKSVLLSVAKGVIIWPVVVLADQGSIPGLGYNSYCILLLLITIEKITYKLEKPSIKVTL